MWLTLRMDSGILGLCTNEDDEIAYKDIRIYDKIRLKRWFYKRLM